MSENIDKNFFNLNRLYSVGDNGAANKFQPSLSGNNKRMASFARE